MCNSVHKGNQKRRGCMPNVPDEYPPYDARFRPVTKGRAWKVMYRDSQGVLRSAFKKSEYSSRDTGSWQKWNNYLSNGDGFCFFMHKKDAVALADLLAVEGDWGGLHVVREIEYDEGVGTFWSDETDGVIRRVGIAKRFRVIREVE